jgi:hypothetical protein
LQEQCALADRELRLGPDAEKVRRFIFETVVMIGHQAFERCPLLAAVMDELPFVFANCATRRRFGSRAKLRSALHTDKVFHRGYLISLTEYEKCAGRPLRCANQRK